MKKTILITLVLGTSLLACAEDKTTWADVGASGLCKRVQIAAVPKLPVQTKVTL